MKKFGALLLLMAAMLVAAPAFDSVQAAQRGPQNGPAAGWNHPDISPEKQAAYEKIINEYRSKVRPLHNDMWAKNAELRYVSRDDGNEKAVSKLIGDIKDLREKIQVLNDNTAAQLSKDLGISTDHAYSLLAQGSMNRGMGCGMRGRMGYGPHHDGYNDGPRGGYHGGPNGGGEGGHRGYHRGM